ncbi:MAG: glucose-1-phosphate cytidylyltransferase [Candidatus Niyogibacteria bacterium CG10_big_fil_rev_8_21_14_0_10_46_36]|uniref:Glucose-1-phosphate cytidylyltransferase n=1 Tax=Candidatus Niyogibacteria bacterium CG10_big_fil_rev_8_21_14_0_10_46_36 TaxID=1974726 RepID=A0A2H0TCN1_9BACT|nr:MAG: glucose-1-phosphate cytidylyltransferase [Candidatus Niyogibacteria bacterium CG10_big_fil_rev_8_21_14_0_10_46_36]
METNDTKNTKVVILAGGYGTRISEETAVRPKPMVEIGGKPILWHIMKMYAHFGYKDFVILCGYKSDVIKDYFSNYFLRKSDVTIDVLNQKLEVIKNGIEDWRVTLIDTGEKTLTGGRLKRAREYIGDDTFLMTYGDGVSNVDVLALVDFHKNEKALVTVTAVKSPGRFGTFHLKKGQTRIKNFREKPEDDGIRINGGFFVVEPKALDYIAGDDTSWELEPMQKLAERGELAGFHHDGFWHPMDTLRDKHVLEEMWQKGAPWNIWEK